MSDRSISKDAVVIERTFDAPIDLIWQMWTQPEHFKRWYGPKGFSVPVAEMDVRVGGKRLVCMEMQTPDRNTKMWFTGEYREVTPTKRLVYTDSMADENGNDARRYPSRLRRSWRLGTSLRQDGRVHQNCP